LLKGWILQGLAYFPENEILKMLLDGEKAVLNAEINSKNLVEPSNTIKQFLNQSRPVKTTVICAVWNKDPNREALLRGHRSNLASQTRLVDIIYVFDGGDCPSFDVKARTVSVGEDLTIYQAWNVALSLVETPYVMNLNLDDRLNFNAIEILEDTLDFDSKIGLVGGDWKVCFDQPTTDFVGTCSSCKTHDFSPTWPPTQNKPTRLGSGDGSRGTYGPACMWRMDIHLKVTRYPWRLKNGQKIKVVSDAVWWGMIKYTTNYSLYRKDLIIGNYFSHPNDQAEFRDKDIDEMELVKSVGVSLR
jgi:hypothetical protein